MWQRIASIDALLVAAAAFVAVAFVSLNRIVHVQRVISWIRSVMIVINV